MILYCSFQELTSWWYLLGHTLRCFGFTLKWPIKVGYKWLHSYWSLLMRTKAFLVSLETLTKPSRHRPLLSLQAINRWRALELEEVSTEWKCMFDDEANSQYEVLMYDRPVSCAMQHLSTMNPTNCATLPLSQVTDQAWWTHLSDRNVSLMPLEASSVWGQAPCWEFDGSRGIGDGG